MSSGTIYYAIVAKGKDTILTEYTSYKGNFKQYATQLMERIQENTMKTFELEEYFFHYINEFGISVLCMTDKKFERKLAFAFLQDVKKSLLEHYTSRDLQNASEGQLSTFSQTISEKIVSSSLTVTMVGILDVEPSWVWGQD